MQGVPGQFDDIRDRASFRRLPDIAGVELYHAHIARYAFEPHTHQAFGIGAIEHGAERFRYRGAQHTAGVGALITMNPDELHTGQALTEDGWRYRMIYLEPELLENLTGEPGRFFGDVVHDSPKLARHTLALIGQIASSQDTLEQHGLLLTLAQSLIPLTQTTSPSAISPRLLHVREYLHDNFMQPLTLETLAQVATMSPYHFQRQFKAAFHATPHQMLMAIRLWRAKALLTQGMPPAEVASATGLSDQAHLTRAFAHRYGVTPARYQKQVRG
ncbi:AraC family transcriptional regulator [Enterobacteriaceae bacterium 4M9]|nr:AraC family transcriptional regulator [Enterobacteriaceae bacterium 4M9]